MGKLLVVTRKPGERITIGPVISLELVEIDEARRAKLALVSPEPLTLVSDSLRIEERIPATPEAPARAELALAVSDSVVINDEIKLMAVAVKGEQVRLGIDAPVNVRISRLRAGD
jgi:sRNA-binding carbon storage regulator CsrA